MIGRRRNQITTSIAYLLAVCTLISCNQNIKAVGDQDDTFSRGILFVSNQSGNHEIYLSDIQTGDRTNLSNNAASDLEPDWNKFSKKIVFSSNRDGNFEIYKMDLDGENQVRLTSTTGNAGSPKWSPDGKQIAFISGDADDGNSQIFLVNQDGSGLTQLSKDQDRYYEITWSPDGENMAACVAKQIGENFYSKTRIVIFSMKQREISNIDYHFDDDCEPSWSPDKKTLIFTSNRNGISSIYELTLSENSLKRLPINMYYISNPSWGNLGREIFFSGKEKNTHYNIYSYNLQTNEVNEVIGDEFNKTASQMIYVELNTEY